MRMAEVIANTMKEYDVEYLFSFSGGDFDLFSAVRKAGIRYVLARSERSAVYMADAYARLTGKPSFVYAQHGPGATYIVPGLTDAFWANSPVIAITSSTNSNVRYRRAYQEVEQQPLYTAITKWNAEATTPNRLADILRTAIRTAVSGVPGPVHLDVPNELLFGGPPLTQEPEIYAEPGFKKASTHHVAPVPASLEQAVAVLAEAERPMILAGGGVMISEAWREVTGLAELLSIPVVTSPAGKGAIAEAHPLAVGVVGRYGRKVANDVASEADTYLVIGSHLGSMATDTYRLPAPGTRIIHMDIDPVALGRNYREAVSIVADAQIGLRGLIVAAEAAGLPQRAASWRTWTERVGERVQAWRTEYSRLAAEKVAGGKVSPYFVLRTLCEHFSQDDIVVADTGYMAAWAGALWETKAPGKGFLRAAGSLGWGFPASLGAQLAKTDHGRVCCLTGDGGLGYHISDLETALRLGLPVVVVVLNNASLAFEYHVQKYMVDDANVCPEVSDLLDVDHAAVAKAFGAYGERVEDPDAFEPALKRALAAGKPAVLDVVISAEVPAPVTYYERTLGRTV